MIKHVALILTVVLSIGASTVDIRKDPAYRRAVTDGAQAQICVKVIDDDGRPVPQVNVMAVIAMRFSEYQQRGQTDTNGCFVVEGKTTGNYIELWAEKEGYYKSKKKLILVGPEHAHEVKDGKWQPYGATEKVVLRQKGDRKLQKVFRHLHCPLTNTWLGVDLKVADWVKPHGSGTVGDIEVNVQWDGLPPWKSRFCKMDVRFPIRDSGYYWADNVMESESHYVFRAERNRSCLKSYVYEDRVDGKIAPSLEFGRTHSMVVCSRCVHSPEGVLQFVNFCGVFCLEIEPSAEGSALFNVGTVFNPVPNDLNLEPAER